MTVEDTREARDGMHALPISRNAPEKVGDSYLLMEAIDALTRAYAISGDFLEPKRAAMSLSAQFPQSGHALSAIVRVIEESAGRNGTAQVLQTEPSA